MGLGAAVRQRLGRWEIPAIEVYRNRFINLDDFAANLASLTTAKRILEIGCGDGALAQRICAAFPDAEYLGIDIAPDPGRLFQGDRAHATFRSLPSSDLIAEGPAPFDLVVICDVLHHVPEPQRIPILRDADQLTAMDGLIAIKDWERGAGVAHVMAYTADRYISGDQNVRFPSREELRRVVDEGLPGFAVVSESRIPPRRNNVLYALRRAH
ncbi:class I SAM-dependent methyltransferase [Plantactinospora sp. GCM10030261]|uniref:class I SAM-dependent methyltransferase n=1 Tax=Plantactinospora sp. GCM10030261 TaxID=3273420 RepID=UPI00360AFA22